MKVVCSYCEQSGKPALLMEKAPLNDPTVSHGICADHLRQVLREIAVFAGALLDPGNAKGSILPIAPRHAQGDGIREEEIQENTTEPDTPDL